MWGPGRDPGVKKDISGKTSGSQGKSGVQLIIKHHRWPPGSDTCTMAMSVSGNAGSGAWKLSVLALRVFCKSEVIPKLS